MRLESMVVVLLLSALVSSCGANKPAAIDAAPGSDADLGGDASTSEVRGTAMDIYYRSPTSTSTIARDLSGYVLQAFIADGSPGGFRTVDATISGTAFTIADVPEGTYYLRMLAPLDPVVHFHETASHTIDLGTTRIGRSDGPLATKPTTLTLHLGGLSPTQAGDELYIQSYSTGLRRLFFADREMTGLDPYSMEVQNIAPRLLDASKGDDLNVMHRHTSYVQAGTFWSTIVDTFSTHSVTLSEGQETNVFGTFAAPTTTRSQHYQLDPASYARGLDIPGHQGLLLFVDVFAGFTGARSAGPSLFHIDQRSNRSTELREGTVTYPDPFPDDWPRFVVVEPDGAVKYVPRGTARTTSTTSYVPNTFARIPLEPTLSVVAPFRAPRSIRVLGMDAKSARAVPFDGKRPATATWDPVPGVSHYVVSIVHVVADGDDTKYDLIATFDVSNNRVTMPSSLFQVGDSYFLAVAAVADPTIDFTAGMLRRHGFPIWQQEAVTARLLFAAACGNGIIDAPYEECDGLGVMSSDCNPDCTTPRCGDGFANAAAGEACDDAGTSLDCSDSCTPASCGDGHIGSHEDCDDLNTADGDGCSSDCLIEPGWGCGGEPSQCTRQ
jgi:cysteine-rich repeat protein